VVAVRSGECAVDSGDVEVEKNFAQNHGADPVIQQPQSQVCKTFHQHRQKHFKVTRLVALKNRDKAKKILNFFLELLKRPE
jgi:shikimate kinase